MNHRTVAVIGSFKQHNISVQAVCAELRGAAIEVTSPVGKDLLQEGIDFVRFESDPKTWDDASIQSLALHRIFRAELVYVVLPGGYIGRTTCYEVGRVIQRKQPIYFSDRPLDLPLFVPDDHIVSPAELSSYLQNPGWTAEWLYQSPVDRAEILECELVAGKFRNE
jgi:hypothetical protein